MAAWDDGDGRRDGGAEASFAAFLAAYNDITRCTTRSRAAAASR